MNCATPVIVLFSLLAALVSVQTDLDRQNEAAHDFWDELTEGTGKAENYGHWERIVRRSASHWNDPSYRDTEPIVDVQEYYRQVLENDWHEDSEAWAEEELLRLMEVWLEGDQAAAQSESHYVKEVQKRIPGRYIVMLQSSANEHVLDKTIALLQHAHTESEGRIRAEHISPIRSLALGFTATLNNKTVQLMMKHPYLEVIEEDVALKRSSVYEDKLAQVEHHAGVPWNLDRLDQRSNILDGHYEPEGDGNIASIYIIDTGIHYSHEEFEGRAHYAGFDAIDKLTGSDRKGADCQGHGTHCAATAAGKTYGVAKKASIYSLRTLDCTGSGAVSGIVEAMDFIAKKVADGAHEGPVVFSMSLGVKESVSLNAAVQRAIKMNIAVVSAAGNQGGDSCNYSPASARVGIAVGATNKEDSTLSFSNAGECTDIYAPGKAIKSASSDCDTCTKVLTGTSMATPHAAGYMAIILSLNPQLSSAEAKQKMIESSTKNTIGLLAISSSLASQTHNRLLYVNHQE